jgi:hypothetical protein
LSSCACHLCHDASKANRINGCHNTFAKALGIMTASNNTEIHSMNCCYSQLSHPCLRRIVQTVDAASSQRIHTQPGRLPFTGSPMFDERTTRAAYSSSVLGCTADRRLIDIIDDVLDILEADVSPIPSEHIAKQ